MEFRNMIINDIFLILLATIIGYLVGSTPIGYLIVRFFGGKDIRQHGSGRTGGSNVGRVLGTQGFILTILLDVLKGALAVILARLIMSQLNLGFWPEVTAGIGCVIGHNWSIFLGFKGGAGTTPSLGAAAALMGFWVTLLAAFLGILALLVWSMASVASLITVWSLPFIFGTRFVLGVGPWEHMVYGVISATIITWALRPNIQRIFKGTERRLWFGLNKADGLK